MSIYWMLLAVVAFSGVTMAFFDRLGRSAWMARWRIRADKPTSVEPAEHLRSQIVNSVVSLGLVFGTIALAGEALIAANERTLLRQIGDAVAILALYDFGYYLLHRFIFHETRWGRRIHAVHHRIRTPFAPDSIFIHPAETALGVGLLMACALLVGPVSAATFAGCFLVYSVLNILVHAAFNIPRFPFRAMSALSVHHDVHHTSMKGGYYASITPLWDLIFKTAR